MAVEKKKFIAVGGFDAHHLKVAFNDVDICLRLREAGYSNVYTPYAELLHLESATRGGDHIADNIARFRSEIAFMEDRWARELARDPFYNENLTKDAEDFSLALARH
jgi:GT2 family glycosyltransferase